MPLKEKDIEDKKFEVLLEQKRHNELKVMLDKLTNAVSNKEDKAIVDAINGQGIKMEALVKAIQNIPSPKIPDVKVEYNTKEFVSSVNKICLDIIESNNKVIKALENRILPDTFEMSRGYGGLVESVKVNYKKANLINIPKYQA
jgi:hypothetical protein